MTAAACTQPPAISGALYEVTPGQDAKLVAVLPREKDEADRAAGFAVRGEQALVVSNVNIRDPNVLAQFFCPDCIIPTPRLDFVDLQSGALTPAQTPGLVSGELPVTANADGFFVADINGVETVSATGALSKDARGDAFELVAGADGRLAFVDGVHAGFVDPHEGLTDWSAPPTPFTLPTLLVARPHGGYAGIVGAQNNAHKDALAVAFFDANGTMTTSATFEPNLPDSALSSNLDLAATALAATDDAAFVLRNDAGHFRILRATLDGAPPRETATTALDDNVAQVWLEGRQIEQMIATDDHTLELVLSPRFHDAAQTDAQVMVLEIDADTGAARRQTLLEMDLKSVTRASLTKVGDHLLVLVSGPARS